MEEKVDNNNINLCHENIKINAFLYCLVQLGGGRLMNFHCIGGHCYALKNMLSFYAPPTVFK